MTGSETESIGASVMKTDHGRKFCFGSVFKDLTQHDREVTAEQSGSPHVDRRGKRREEGQEGRIGKALIEGKIGEQK